MQELIEQLSRFFPEIKNGNAIDKAFWLEKEKEQIIDAYDSGASQIIDINECNKPKHNSAEQYYNETFKND